MSRWGLAGTLAEALRHDWHGHARADQLPPAGDWFGWLILAGRGWGKTRTGAEWVRGEVEGNRAGRIALVGPTAADVRDVMVEGQSGLLAVSPASFRPVYEPSKRRLTWPNGALPFCFSAEEAERLRGPQHDAAWCDELGAWADAEATWDQLMFGLRLGARPRVAITTTPKPTRLIRALVGRPDFRVTRGRTADNAANLAPTFLETIVGRYGGTRLGRQELDAEILEDVPGALWTRDRIEALRVERAPELRRVVVAIDPAVTAGEDSDETGLVVAGVGADGHGYVLEDASGRHAPTEWARRAVALFHRHGADRIVAEVNQGSALVEATLRVVDGNVPYRGVHASRGKIIRAEPVSALYEQGRVHHVGALPALEDQLCTFAPGSARSPDRLDALVYALTELIVGAPGAGILEFYRREAEAAGAPGGLADRDELRWRMPSMAGAPTRTVRLRVPEGHTVTTLSGAPVVVEADGTALFSEADSIPFRQLGWEIVATPAADG